jgi:hypothetical protein
VVVHATVCSHWMQSLPLQRSFGEQTCAQTLADGLEISSKLAISHNCNLEAKVLDQTCYWVEL